MIEPQAERDTRRAALEPWHCSACRRVLMEVDFDRPSFIRKVCERCKHVNLFVEAFRPR